MYIDTTFPCIHIYYIFFLYFSNFAISFCILHVIGRIFIEWERRQFSFFILLCCVDVLYIPSFSAKSLSSLSLSRLSFAAAAATNESPTFRENNTICAWKYIHLEIYIYRSVILFLFSPYWAHINDTIV